MGKKVSKLVVSAEDAAAAKASTEGLVGGFKGVQTFAAYTGTIYGIVAEAKGLTLAITPKIEAGMIGPVVGVFVRVRISKKEDWANLEEGGALFGFPEIVVKSNKHASCEIFVAAALKPVTPFQVGKALENNKIIESIVAVLVQRVQDAGQTLILPTDSIVDYLRSVFEGSLPTEEESQKVLTEFPVVVGGKAIHDRMLAIRDEFYPKPPKAAAQSGDDEQEETDPE